MIEWHEYVEQLLQSNSIFDGLSLSLGDDIQASHIPPIVKSSILMLDKMVVHQGKYNILIFPERMQSIFIFTLMKLLHDIAQGEIEKAYNPSAFQPGEKLKLGKAVVEFLGIEDCEGKLRMKIRLADLTSSAPIDFFPLFQRTSTQRGLTKYLQFVEVKREAEKKVKSLSPDERQLAILADHRTHMNSSIFNMTSIINAKEIIAGCSLCGQKITDTLLFGQADYSGSVKNVGAGQLAGIPSIVLASDLYAIIAALDAGHPAQSIVVDASDSNKLLNQIDALDNLMHRDIPITFVTDIVNSFDLDPFELRGFNVWRWDESSITPSLYDVSYLPLEQKVKNCATRDVRYLTVDGQEISDVIRMISLHRKESAESSVQLMRLYEQMSSLAFAALRQTIPFEAGEVSRANSWLNEVVRILADEKPYLAPNQYEAYKDAITKLRAIYATKYQLAKHTILSEHLLAEDHEEICLVVPERADKKRIWMYWQSWCYQNGLSTAVRVVYPAEYYSLDNIEASVTIIVGWLKRAMMRKILYSFNTQRVVVLLYDHENRWKNYDTSKWSAAIKRSSNVKTVNQSFCNERTRISISRFSEEYVPAPIDRPTVDELNEIELVLRENKFRQYVVNGGKSSVESTVEAIPINYVGGFLAFYKKGHKVISATKVITQDAEKIETVFPDSLQVGDFIVVRESDRDIIKEIADIALGNSGKSELRTLATKWKEVLEIEQLFSTSEEIYNKLVAVGCKKGYPTIRGWLVDEDMIAPQNKEDLQYIAAITEDSVMNELVDQIYDAAQEVKSAHVQAGRFLSEQLRRRIVEALGNYGTIDPFNIWEPIEMSIEGIGLVRILKIIDVGVPMIVDAADTNHLIEE